MPVKPNLFKRGLAEEKTQFGLWLGLADPYSAEICAGAAFHWLLVDAEHAPNDTRSVLAQLQALEAYASHPIVRIPTADVTLIKQMLDIGVQSILVPCVESAEQAQMLARGMRYPPAGIRGVGTALARAARWGGIPDYLAVADEEACLIVQIETLAGVRNAAAIAAVSGVDGVFIGPADLAASLGHRGDAGHVEVQRAIQDLVGVIRVAGKPAGILATNEDLVRQSIAWGCTFVAVGLDTALLRVATRQLAGRYMSSPIETSRTKTDGYK
jgi:4-hydroxy-2-oxoheptanedioate aldolase